MRREFDRSLKNVAKPALIDFGYEFDGKRRFTKIDRTGKQLVIEYQVGIRAAQGTFTVNLIKGETTDRLNTVNPTWFSKLVNRLFGAYDPWWKGVFLPKEKWRKISPFQKEMDAIVLKTVGELKAYGIAWLEHGKPT